MEKKIKFLDSKILDDISLDDIYDRIIFKILSEGMAEYYSSKISKEIMQNLKKIIKEDSKWKV